MCRVFCCVEFKGANTEQNPGPEATVASVLMDLVDPGLPLTGRGALRGSWVVLVTGSLIREPKKGEVMLKQLGQGTGWHGPYAGWMDA